MAIKTVSASASGYFGIGASGNDVIRSVIQGELAASGKIIDLSDQLASLADAVPTEKRDQFKEIVKQLLQEALAVSSHAQKLAKTL